MMPVYDADAAELRDEGTARVLAHAGAPWVNDAINCIREFWGGREGIAEEFRLTCEQHGISPPHHNAWGALILGMKRKEILIGTGQWRSMSTAKSHARSSEVYRVAPLAKPQPHWIEPKKKGQQNLFGG